MDFLQEGGERFLRHPWGVQHVNECEIHWVPVHAEVVDTDDFASRVHTADGMHEHLGPGGKDSCMCLDHGCLYADGPLEGGPVSCRNSGVDVDHVLQSVDMLEKGSTD